MKQCSDDGVPFEHTKCERPKREEQMFHPYQMTCECGICVSILTASPLFVALYCSNCLADIAYRFGIGSNCKHSNPEDTCQESWKRDDGYKSRKYECRPDEKYANGYKMVSIHYKNEFCTEEGDEVSWYLLARTRMIYCSALECLQVLRAILLFAHSNSNLLQKYA